MHIYEDNYISTNILGPTVPRPIPGPGPGNGTSISGPGILFQINLKVMDFLVLSGSRVLYILARVFMFWHPDSEHVFVF